MRINMADCDTPVPTTEDVEALHSGVPDDYAAKYLPDDKNRLLPRIWASLLETTLSLGSILANHYRAKPLDEHPTTLISRDQDKLQRCRSGFPAEEACNNAVTLSHLYHLDIYYE